MRRFLAFRPSSSVGSIPGWPRSSSVSAFTLVELLTVVFIISLLIAILVPALSSARTATKKAVSGQALKAISVGLESFRNDSGADFVQTHGYPPSFVHPPIPGWSVPDAERYRGRFPFVKDYPIAYGAHWLSAMLMGIDSKGYIRAKAVPEGRRSKPEEWYPDPAAPGPDLEPLSRVEPYCDPGNLRTILTKDLPGQPSGPEFWEDKGSWTGNTRSVGRLPVIVDGFDYPVLYYAANKNGRPTNMVADAHDPNNEYPDTGPQTNGVPFYFFDDNVGFTGRDNNEDFSDGVELPGWDLNGPHEIGASGANLGADAIMKEEPSANRKNSFARMIVDRKIFRDLKNQDPNAIKDTTPLRPVNADSYILWSPGADGRWGTNDDVSNMPPFVD